MSLSGPYRRGSSTQPRALVSRYVARSYTYSLEVRGSSATFSAPTEPVEIRRVRTLSRSHRLGLLLPRVSQLQHDLGPVPVGYIENFFDSRLGVRLRETGAEVKVRRRERDVFGRRPRIDRRADVPQLPQL